MPLINQHQKIIKTFEIELKPGQTLVIFDTPEAMQALYDGLTDAETFTGRKHHKQAFKNSFIVKN